MRRDFEYVQVIALSAANDKARRRAKKTLITGSMVACLAVGIWPAGIAMFGLLIVTNVVQSKTK